MAGGMGGAARRVGLGGLRNVHMIARHLCRYGSCARPDRPSRWTSKEAVASSSRFGRRLDRIRPRATFTLLASLIQAHAARLLFPLPKSLDAPPPRARFDV
jgi:hypothetical protein